MQRSGDLSGCSIADSPLGLHVSGLVEELDVRFTALQKEAALSLGKMQALKSEELLVPFEKFEDIRIPESTLRPWQERAHSSVQR